MSKMADARLTSTNGRMRPSDWTENSPTRTKENSVNSSKGLKKENLMLR